MVKYANICNINIKIRFHKCTKKSCFTPCLIYLSLQGQCAAVTTHSLLIINITIFHLCLIILHQDYNHPNYHHAVPVEQAGPTAESVKSSGRLEHNEDKPRVLFLVVTPCTVWITFLFFQSSPINLITSRSGSGLLKSLPQGHLKLR